MLKSSDLLHLPYTPDLTEGGIAYACRALASTSERMDGSRPRTLSGNLETLAGTGTNLERLRRLVARVAAELAFRRYLSEQSVPFGVLDATPFTHPNRYEVSLGGHRCHLKSFHITRRQQIARLRQDPALVLQAPALVPLDQIAAEGCKPDDLYIFAFLLGVVAASQEDADKAAAAGQPAWLVHPLPDEWARPVGWIPLKNLTLKSECEAPISVEIGGQNADREFVTAALELPSRKRLPVDQVFHSLAYIHVARRPEARIGIHSPTRAVVPVPANQSRFQRGSPGFRTGHGAQGGEAYLIPPHAWGNIWFYGMDILLTGWLSHEEYRRKAKVLNAGMRTLQYDRTRVKNLLVPVAELNPIMLLFERVRAWVATH